ncbi:methyltransferase domain-containing protein [Jatrophihabitans sp. YIM 134969]
MDAREANRRTLAVYEAHADRYLTARTDPPAPLVELYDRLAALAPGGTVLELGSGPGDCALALERRGLRVRRTDATVAFVDRLRAGGQTADVLNALTDDLGGPYDVLFANAVLLHFAPDDLAALLQRATLAASWLAFTVKEGDGDVWSTRKLDAPRWFVHWREPALRDLLTEAGWRVTWLEHGHGRYDDWMTVLAERA